MYILKTITSGKPLDIIGSSRKALEPYMARADDWRLHDSTGWCDAKFPDSWERFQLDGMQILGQDRKGNPKIRSVVLERPA